jgi:uncharacterized protein YbgA (DUF1722 family)/uncharacterized protein YbbK (DUF523 family)
MMQEIVDRPTLGISSCLLGNQVRFDGGHKNNAYVNKTLGQYFEFQAFCPEQAIGLPTPRPPIRLVAEPGEQLIRAVGVRDPSAEFTDALDQYGRDICKQSQELSGYIVKKDSPSCGMERVKVYERQDAPPVKRGAGIFTARILQERPELPVEEEGRLMDPHLRENFITRVFTMHRWLQMVAAGLTKKSLVEFHTRHKFLLLAQHEATYRELGRLVADIGNQDSLGECAQEYLKRLMSGMRHLANPGKHANVLMHIMGFVKDHMTPDEKVELLDLIEAHQQELVPVIVPITLLNHFLRKYPHEYVAKQYYLKPHPRELMLRNSI